MKVSELREALAAFNDQDAQVVVGLDPREWVKPLYTAPVVADFGMVEERAFFIAVPELPAEKPNDEDCPRCSRLEDAIADARSALDNAE